MTKQRPGVEASLLYQVERAPFDSVDVVALRSMIESLGQSVQHVRIEANEFILFVCEHVQILIAVCNLPFSMDHFLGVWCPADEADGQAEVLALLARHRASLTVLILDRDDCLSPADTRASDDVKNQLCRESVDLLLSTTAPDLVFWSGDDILLTAAEAEAAIEAMWQDDMPPPQPGCAAGAAENTLACGIVHPTRPLRPDARTARPPVLAPLYGSDIAREAIDWAAMWSATPDSVPNSVRPKRHLRAKAMGSRPAYLSNDPHLSREALEWFNAADAPVEDSSKASGGFSALCAFLALDKSQEAKRVSETATGRASIYIMSATIAVFAMPVGASMLTYNALSGGSFRITSHMMALTGIGMFLTSIGVPIPAAAFAGVF